MFFAAKVDLFGPCIAYVPGYERETRNRTALATEVHVMSMLAVTLAISLLGGLENVDAKTMISPSSYLILHHLQLCRLSLLQSFFTVKTAVLRMRSQQLLRC